MFDNPYEWSGGKVGNGSITPSSNQGIAEDYKFKTTNGNMIALTANHFWVDVDNYLAGIKIKEAGHTITIQFMKNGTKSKNPYSMTGEGDATRILATVVDIIKHIIKKHKSMTLLFCADKGNELIGRDSGRAGAYGAIINRFANTLGYNTEVNEGRLIKWQLTKK